MADSLKTDYSFKKDFPIFSKKINGKDLVYLDNAATTQKPLEVINRLTQFYKEENSNVHRGVHTLSQNATIAYEEVREKVRSFLSAQNQEEIIFTSGTTDALNLIAYSYGINNLQAEDEIILTEMEHHSNIVPWQIIQEKTKAIIKVVKLTRDGKLDLEHFHSLLSNKTKIVSVVYVSNSLGTINPIKEIIHASHQVGAVAIVDASQAVAHFPINVESLDCDFLVFTAHKLFALNGVGVLYGKKNILEKMQPFKGGGGMILKVSFEKTLYQKPPHRFEAGTPNIAGVIGLGEAISYIKKIGFSKIEKSENQLTQLANKMLKTIPGVRIFGDHQDKVGIFSFLIDDIHPHDVGTILDQSGVAVRVGHHCNQPVMDYFNVPGTIRASLSFYNDENDIIQLEKALHQVLEVFKK